MRAHTWVTKTDYAPNIGEYDFEQCSVCGASAPSVFRATPFYADGSGLGVSDDCDEAKAQIAAHVATWVPPDRRPTKPFPEARVGPMLPGLTPEDLARFEASAHEMADLGYQLWGAKHDHLDPDRMGSFRAHCDAEHEKIEAQWAREAEDWRRSHEDKAHDGG